MSGSKKSNSGLSKEQHIEMLTEIRLLRGTGKPEIAAGIQLALDEGRYFLGSKVVPIEVQPPSKSATTEAWANFAKEQSEIDHEVIDDQSRNDLIKMLQANGLIV